MLILLIPKLGKNIHKPHASTHKHTVLKHALLPHPSAQPHVARAVYGWGVVVESLESADLPLIDDSICGSLPVRALNSGRRGAFGHEGEGEGLPIHLSAAQSYCPGEKLARTEPRSDATRAEVFTVVLLEDWPQRK